MEDEIIQIDYTISPQYWNDVAVRVITTTNAEGSKSSVSQFVISGGRCVYDADGNQIQYVGTEGQSEEDCVRGLADLMKNEVIQAFILNRT